MHDLKLISDWLREELLRAGHEVGPAALDSGTRPFYFCRTCGPGRTWVRFFDAYLVVSGPGLRSVRRVHYADPDLVGSILA